MDIRLGDVLTLKKGHPCGENRWLVLQTGENLRLRCMGCAHEVVLSSIKVQKSIRTLRHPENSST